MLKLSVASGVTLALLMATSAMALECPVLAAINDPASAAAVQRILPEGVDLDAPEALQSSVFELKQAGVPEDTILDNLIAAYCSSVSAAPGLTDDEKIQKVQDFSQETDNAVFDDAQ